MTNIIKQVCTKLLNQNVTNNFFQCMREKYGCMKGTTANVLNKNYIYISRTLNKYRRYLNTHLLHALNSLLRYEHGILRNVNISQIHLTLYLKTLKDS